MRREITYTSTMTVQNRHCVTRNGGLLGSSTPAYPFQLSIPGPPFSYVYHLLYAYPALLPLAMARPEHEAFKEEVAFKFFFCPGGVSLGWIRLHSHLSLRRWFPVQCQEVHESTLEQSTTGTLMKPLPQSIYLAIGNCRKEEWLVPSNPGGVIYTSGNLKTAEPRSVLLTTLLFKSPSMTHLKRTLSLP
jgi:hypothetical protein